LSKLKIGGGSIPEAQWARYKFSSMNFLQARCRKLRRAFLFATKIQRHKNIFCFRRSAAEAGDPSFFIPESTGMRSISCFPCFSGKNSLG
jgi:hypothetical protein